MARIRTIKPEFPQSESVGSLTRNARLLFIQLWTIVDDAGRTRAASRMLASLLYPYDDDAKDLIEGWMAELEKGNHIRRYDVGGSQYLEIVKWLEHQKIDKPSKSRLPSFDEGSRILAKPREASATDLVPRTLDLVPSTNAEANASGAGAPLDPVCLDGEPDEPIIPDPAIPNREYFLRGREVLGPKSGGLLGKLLKAKGGNVALARAAIEQASQKATPTEYIAACCLDRPSKTLTPYQQEIQETRSIIDGLKAYSEGSDRRGGENPRLLSHDHRQ